MDVKTEVRNASSAAATVVLKTAILDPAGKQVAEYSTNQKIDAGALVTVEQSGELSGPKLWSPETPKLYTAVSRVVVKGVVVRMSFGRASGFAGLRGRRTMGLRSTASIATSTARMCIRTMRAGAMR